MELSPKNGFMIVEPIDEKKETKTASGIIIPETDGSMNHMIGRALVIAVDETSEKKCCDAGDTILYLKSSCHLLQADKNYKLMSDTGVLAVEKK